MVHLPKVNFTNLSNFLLKSSSVRRYLCFLRQVYFKSTSGLKTAYSDKANDMTLYHNMFGIWQTNDRFIKLASPLFSLETFDPSGSTLIVGPRNEHDLLIFKSLGGSWKNTRGLDLITYSPKIDLGDMHSMPYQENTYDTVICGWTLSYSDNPSAAVSEMLRVLKPGGLLALAVEYSELSEAEVKLLSKNLNMSACSNDGYSIGFDASGQRLINSLADLTELIPHDSELLFKNDADLKLSHSSDYLVPNPSSIIGIFRVNRGT